MPGHLLHVNATVTCPHGGQAASIPAQSRVVVSGQPAATTADAYPIAGCALSASGSPPCVTVRWTGPAARVRANGTPVLLRTSTGLCLNAAQASQGTALVLAAQQRVAGQ